MFFTFMTQQKPHCFQTQTFTNFFLNRRATWVCKSKIPACFTTVRPRFLKLCGILHSSSRSRALLYPAEPVTLHRCLAGLQNTVCQGNPQRLRAKMAIFIFWVTGTCPMTDPAFSPRVHYNHRPEVKANIN